MDFASFVEGDLPTLEKQDPPIYQVACEIERHIEEIEDDAAE